MIHVSVPSYRNIIRDPGRSHTVFHVEVTVSGQCHKLEKRYSAFHTLHKKLKKTIKTPTFPPKKVRNWDQRVLEQRRQALETYIQGILKNQNIPQPVLVFLGLSCLSSSSSISYEANVMGSDIDVMTHQPVLTFNKDVFLLSDSSSSDTLPDVVIDGVLRGFYL